MRAALQALREQGAAACMLLGDLGYYWRFDFRCVPQLVYPSIPPTFFMVLSFTDALHRDMVIFHPR